MRVSPSLRDVHNGSIVDAPSLGLSLAEAGRGEYAKFYSCKDVLLLVNSFGAFPKLVE